uniref:Taste receptor type 2 n=1 Tax=Junco hyemalis TaxID=40217 RepID=A0A8C5NPC9_JUNHY
MVTVTAAMMTSFALLCLSIAIIECMAGILGNGIILAASSLSCIGSKTWPPYDMIMISLSSSKFILQSWITLNFLMSIFYKPFIYTENVHIASQTIFTFLNYSSLWFGAWLSVFYCIKVASFTQSFFIWLKLRIARLVPWMLLTSWLCSFTAAIPFTWHVYSVHENITTDFIDLSLEYKYTFAFNIVVSNVLLIQSLWIHTRQMQNNASGFRDPSLEAHMKTIKSVCSFLIFYITYFICLLLLYSRVFSHLSDEECMCIVILAACPTGHTMVLIWSNPKFRDADNPKNEPRKHLKISHMITADSFLLC